MNKTKKFIKLMVSFFIISNLCFYTNAMSKKNLFKPTENMFNKTPFEKNEIESFSIVLNKKPDFNVSGPELQIFIKAFKNQLINDFKATYKININKYIDDNDLFNIKKENLKDKFVLNIDFNKNKTNSDIKNKFKNHFNFLSNSSPKINKIIENTKKDLKSNFEKYRKEISKDLDSMEKYTNNREKIFNSAVSKKKKEFVKDFQEFTNIASKAYEIYNKDKVKNIRERRKIANSIENEGQNLNLKGTAFKMYKEKVLGPNKNEIKQFKKKYKNILNNVKKQNVMSCADKVVLSGIKIKKY